MVDGVTRESYLSRDVHLLYSLKSKKVVSPADILVNQFMIKSLLNSTGCDVSLQLLLVAEGSCLISTTKISSDLDSSSSWVTDYKEFRNRCFAALVFLFTLLFWTLFLVSLNFSLCLAKTSCVHLGGIPASSCRSGSLLTHAHLQSFADAQALSIALGEPKKCCHSLLHSKIHSIASQHELLHLFFLTVCLQKEIL